MVAYTIKARVCALGEKVSKHFRKTLPAVLRRKVAKERQGVLRWYGGEPYDLANPHVL